MSAGQTSAAEAPRQAEAACGRRVCAWCKPQRDLGPAPKLPVGAVTHGMCPECERREFPEYFLPKKA